MYFLQEMNFLHIIFKHFKLERVNHELRYFTRDRQKQMRITKKTARNLNKKRACSS